MRAHACVARTERKVVTVVSRTAKSEVLLSQHVHTPSGDETRPEGSLGGDRFSFASFLFANLLVPLLYSLAILVCSVYVYTAVVRLNEEPLHL